MADVKPLRADIAVPERKTPEHLIEFLDELRAEAEAGVLTALAVARVVDGEVMCQYAHESGDGMTLIGAVQILGAQITHAFAFDDEGE